MIIVPLLTVLGIIFLHQTHGLHFAFDVHNTNADNLIFLTHVLSVQIIFLLLGLLVPRRQGYPQAFLTGEGISPGSCALVCPGVAMSVMLQFWIHKGLVANGILTKFSTGYWALTAVAIAFQIAMVVLVMHLNRRLFHLPRPETSGFLR